MARDVEFNYTASDKTGAAATSVERRFKKTAESVKKDSDKLGDGIGKSLVQGIEKFSPKLASTLTDTLSGVSEASGPLLAVGIAAAAPLIGATLSAAIIGGAGIGGVIGGVLLAAKDPRVQAAGKALGTNLMSSLQQDAAVFIGPVLSAIGQIKGGFDGIRPRIQSVFNNSSQYVQPLVSGVVKAVDGISRGFEALVSKAGPVIGALSDSFGTLGSAVGDALENIAGGAPDAASAIRDLTNFLAGAIEVVGGTVRALTEMYGVISFIPHKLVDFGNGLKDLISPANKVGTFVDRVATNVGQAGAAASDAAGPIQTFTDKVDNLASEGRNLFDSTTNVGDAIDRFRDALKKNGKTLDENTTKGRANRTALSNLAGALVAQYDATVKVNGEGAKSNTVARDNRTAFVKLATQLGLSKTAAGELASKMGLIPAKKNTSFTANTHDAAARIQALKDQIAALKNKTITLTVARRVTGSSASDSALAAALRKQNFAASGSFAFAGGSDGVSRTGGPAEVKVTSTINNRIDLNGRPFFDYADRTSSAAVSRSNYRQKVGKR
jgi:hypothetical protein